MRGSFADSTSAAVAGFSGVAGVAGVAEAATVEVCRIVVTFCLFSLSIRFRSPSCRCSLLSFSAKARRARELGMASFETASFIVPLPVAAPPAPSVDIGDVEEEEEVVVRLLVRGTLTNSHTALSGRGTLCRRIASSENLVSRPSPSASTVL